jgi:hypothetical protein
MNLELISSIHRCERGADDAGFSEEMRRTDLGLRV